MTKHLYRIAQSLQPIMVGGSPPAGVRDAWATLSRWNESGEAVYRITDRDKETSRAGLPSDLELASAEIVTPACLYIIGRTEWILVARHQAREPYRVAPGAQPRAYDAPMLTYCTDSDGPLASGTINLRATPTAGTLRIGVGTILRKTGEQEQLTMQDIRPELIRLGIVLPHFYRPIAFIA